MTKKTKGQYAYTIKTYRVKEPDFPYQGTPLTCTRELIDFARPLLNSDIEKMVVIYLNAQNEVIGLYVQPGSINQAAVYPREIVKAALLVGACAVSLSHNHPSGHAKPSDSDRVLTNTIKEACKLFDILLHDHLILGDDFAQFSFREDGLL